MSQSIDPTLVDNDPRGRRDNIPENQNSEDLRADVFIVGSGPIGATYAWLLFEAGYDVIMCEMGASTNFRETKDADGKTVFVPGPHKLNDIDYQKDPDRFMGVISAALSPVSVPVTPEATSPIDQNATTNKVSWFKGTNPNQDKDRNMPKQAVTHGVGGMSTHWTCATPRFSPELELPSLDYNDKKSQAEWKRLYDAAEKLIGTTTHALDHSIRHNLVLRTLEEEYKGSRTFEPLPLACDPIPNTDYIHWHGADTILEKIYTHPNPKKGARFRLLSNHLCTLLYPVFFAHPQRVDHAEVKKLPTHIGEAQGPSFNVLATYFVVAAGAVATPQILFNSRAGLRIPNLGKYITEQPVVHARIALKPELIKKIPQNPWNLDWWADKVADQKKNHPNDPLKFPFDDGAPQITSPFSINHMAHIQIDRAAFWDPLNPGEIDTRTVVDLRAFGLCEGRKYNTLTFETDYQDAYGMPQPTFNFSDPDSSDLKEMEYDLRQIAKPLGDFLPNGEPKLMPLGSALHLGGTVRAGLHSDTHVADTYCKVYDFSNLYVGGNGVIPTAFAANPTLTSMGYAIRSAEKIIERLGGRKK